MKSYHLTIEGDFPSLNEFIDANRRSKGRWNKGNQMKQRDQNIICNSICRQLKGVKANVPIYLKYTYYCKNRKRDLDNISGYFHKVFQDALVHSGVINNDSWQYICGFSDEFEVDNKNPRIEVEIIERR